MAAAVYICKIQGATKSGRLMLTGLFEPRAGTSRLALVRLFLCYRLPLRFYIASDANFAWEVVLAGCSVFQHNLGGEGLAGAI